jgi:hypothetical protein
MSSISATDRARQDEQIRQTREEYENREAEGNKRKKAEVQQLQKRHGEEVESIKDSYENRIAELKDRNRETINQRDVDNNRKIEDLRGLYRESLRNKMEDSESTRKAQKASFDGTLKKQKEISESQKGNLVNQLNSEVETRDRVFQENLAENRDKARESIEHNKQKLTAAHEKEKNTILDSHSETLQNKSRTEREMRKSYEGRLRDSERMRSADNARWSQKFADNVENSKDSYGANLEMKQEIMDAERNSLRDKYQNALDKKSQSMDETNDQFRDTVNERVNTQVRSRDSKIQNLSSRLNNEISKNERLRGIERRNLTEAYEKRLSLSEERREDTVDHMKDINNERVEKIIDNSQKLLRNVDRENKSQVGIMNSRHREDREALLTTHKDQIAQVNGTAEERIRKTQDIALKNQDRMGKYYDESLETMKDNYLARVEVQREQASQTTAAQNKLMTERFRSMEQTYGNRMEQLVKGYEDKLAKLTDDHQTEIKRMEKLYGQRLEEQGKASKMEKDSNAMKYESRIAQLNESHTDQLDRMNRRHQEDMQNLAVKMNSYSKKA